MNLFSNENVLKIILSVVIIGEFGVFLCLSRASYNNMKKTQLLVLCFAVININLTMAQIITTTTNKSIPCCSNPPMTVFSDSVDINGDNVYELKIQSMYGIDNLYYFAQGLNGAEISGSNLFGTTFSSYGYASMPQTPMGSYWSGWLPNSGVRYVGIRKVNAPNDTTFGWVKVNFVGNQPGPNDTVKILEYAYNALPNSTLTAGQSLSSSISEQSHFDHIKVYPNISHENIFIENKSVKCANYKIYSIIGQYMCEGGIENNTVKTIELNKLTTGVYFILLVIENSNKIYKIIKE